MFETALVNRKFAKRPKFETMKSLPPPRNSLFATQSPSPPARSSAIRAGKTASAALTVPLTAQAHQNEAKLKSSTPSSQVIPASRFTDMRVDPKMNLSAISSEMGSRPAQTKPVNTAVTSLMSHWRRAGTGRVRCQECVPDVLSSPSDMVPARTAIKGVNAASMSTASADPRSTVNPSTGRQIHAGTASRLISQTGRNKRSSLRIKLRSGLVERQRSHSATALGIIFGPAISRSSPARPPVT